MQHDYKEWTDISFHLHRCPTTTTAGDVKRQLEYTRQNVNGTYAAPTIITVTTPAGWTAWVNKIVAFPTITGTGMLINSQIAFRIFRDPTDVADTYPDDAGLVQIGIHYECDTTWSRTIATK
jgi:hypothetical protein